MCVNNILWLFNMKTNPTKLHMVYCSTYTLLTYLFLVINMTRSCDLILQTWFLSPDGNWLYGLCNVSKPHILNSQVTTGVRQGNLLSRPLNDSMHMGCYNSISHKIRIQFGYRGGLLWLVIIRFASYSVKVDEHDKKYHINPHEWITLGKRNKSHQRGVRIFRGIQYTNR